MSIVIAVKFNNGVIMASDKQVTSYGNKIEDQVSKIKLVNPGIMFGGVGLLRELQQLFLVSENLFNSKEIFENGLTKEQCITAMNKLTIEFRNNLFIEQNKIVDQIYGRFIAADAYNINVIEGDLAILSGFKYYAIGSGEDLVMGHLNVVFEKKDPESLNRKEAMKILKECIEIACKDNCYIDNNIDTLVQYKSLYDIVDDEKFEVVTSCEYDLLNKQKLKTKTECNKNCESCKHNLRMIFNKEAKTLYGIANNL